MRRTLPAILFSLSLVASLSVTGCDLGDALEAVTGDVVFDIADPNGGEGSPSLVLSIETVDIYPSTCLLWVRFEPGDTMRAEILGVDTQGICLPSSGPARSSFPFGVPEGTYDFEIEHGGHTDRYRIVVAGGEVEVETLSAEVSCHMDDLHVGDEGRFCMRNGEV